MRHFDFSPRHPSPATSVTWACLAFLAWLVSALRPTTLVSLGSRSTPYPVSLCSYVPTSPTNNQGLLNLSPLHWLAPAQILIGRVTITCLPRRQARYAAGPQNALRPIALLSCSLLTLDQKVLVHGANARKVPGRVVTSAAFIIQKLELIIHVLLLNTLGVAVKGLNMLQFY